MIKTSQKIDFYSEKAKSVVETWKMAGCPVEKMTLGFATFFNAYNAAEAELTFINKTINSIGTHNYNQVCRLSWKSKSVSDKGHICDVDDSKAKISNF